MIEDLGRLFARSYRADTMRTIADFSAAASAAADQEDALCAVWWAVAVEAMHAKTLLPNEIRRLSDPDFDRLWSAVASHTAQTVVQISSRVERPFDFGAEVWHELAVILAEVRDERAADRRATDELDAEFAGVRALGVAELVEGDGE